ncbi:hypothetical protein X777_16391, partial [Ooceraea biroi]
APGGDLQTLIDGDLVPLEGDVVHFVRQLVEGLAYLHERNIAHLDIKVSSTHKRSMRTCHASLRVSGSRNRLRRQKFPTVFSATFALRVTFLDYYVSRRICFNDPHIIRDRSSMVHVGTCSV